MSNSKHNPGMSQRDGTAGAADHTELIWRAFAAALGGDVEAVRDLLAEDVHWYGAGGDPEGGCTNREQAMAWMGAAVARGVEAEVLAVRALDEHRVLVRLQRRGSDDGSESPHAQLITFRGDKVAEIVVYPSETEALAAAASF
jgi:ketosteroid isomerase-like protein